MTETKTIPWDTADHLQTAEDIAAYLEAAFEDGDPEVRRVAFLVALAFAVAASANLPVIVLSLFWRRFNTTGAVTGLAVGLLASIGLILIGPSLMAVDPPTLTGAARHLIQAKAWFPLENPGIVSIPLGFLGAILGTLLSHEPSSEHKFNELLVRSNTGLGAERAGSR